MDTIPQDNTPCKQCTGPCGRMLPATTEFFARIIRGKNNLRSRCKICINAENKTYREANQEELKAYRQTNKEQIHQKAKVHRDTHKESYQAYREANKGRRSRNMRAWKQTNKEHVQAYREANKEHLQQTEKAYKQAHSKQIREQKLIARYGITQADYDEMFTRQFGLCAICGQPPRNGKPLQVDHCHKTNLIRELICLRCNAILGYADDNSDVLKRAIKYLKRHST